METPTITGDQIPTSEAIQKFSKALSWLLRHGLASPNIVVYKGGYVEIGEIQRVFRRYNYSLNQIEFIAANSKSKQNGANRFSLLNIYGRVYLKANYAITSRKQEMEMDFPKYVMPHTSVTEEDGPQKLQRICCLQIVKNIKMYEDFKFVQDGFILEVLMNELKAQKKLNNSTLKMFLFDGLDALQLGDEMAVSDATLRRIAQQCPKLRKFTLTGCVSLTDTQIQYITKRCTELRFLQFDDCKYVTDKGLGMIAANLGAKLQSFVISRSPAITDEGIGKLISLCPNIQSLRVADCVNVTQTFITKLPQEYTNLTECEWVPPIFTSSNVDMVDPPK